MTTENSLFKAALRQYRRRSFREAEIQNIYRTNNNRNFNMAQDFYTKWQSSLLNDAGSCVSREYRNFQTALIREISKSAKAVNAAVVANTKGHYFTTCFVERGGKFVYISHSSGLSRMSGNVRIDLDSFLIRTAAHVKDYTGGQNQYCDLPRLQSMTDRLLSR